MEYSIYSDESYSTAERYRSIAAVSFPSIFKKEISSDLASIIDNSKIPQPEFKWQKLKTENSQKCAKEIINYICNNIKDKRIRIDILTWDTHDSRHKLPGRDDKANFERMFYHLANNLMKRRDKESFWKIYPDERLDIDWGTIKDCLTSTGRWRAYIENRLFGEEISEQFYSIKSFEQVDSVEEPCCQVADLFSGMAVFSKNCYQIYKAWLVCNDPQMQLFEDPNPPNITRKQKYRFPVIKCLKDHCRKNSFGVSIDEKGCLYTLKPDNPINFWPYEPQHENDKAPTRH